jgi:hypothetical protein
MMTWHTAFCQWRRKPATPFLSAAMKPLVIEPSALNIGVMMILILVFVGVYFSNLSFLDTLPYQLSGADASEAEDDDEEAGLPKCPFAAAGAQRAAPSACPFSGAAGAQRAPPSACPFTAVQRVAPSSSCPFSGAAAPARPPTSSAPCSYEVERRRAGIRFGLGHVD